MVILGFFDVDLPFNFPPQIRNRLIIRREVPLRFILQLRRFEFWGHDCVMHDMRPVYSIHRLHPTIVSLSPLTPLLIQEIDSPIIQA